MKKRFTLFLSLALVVLASSACSIAGKSISSSGTPGIPSVVVIRPGADATSGPQASLPNLQEVTGTVKEVKEGLVLITRQDGGGDYRLRFSENTRFAEGLSLAMVVEGKAITCRVKDEPTFAPPSQGEVFEVLGIGQ